MVTVLADPLTVEDLVESRETEREKPKVEAWARAVLRRVAFLRTSTGKRVLTPGELSAITAAYTLGVNATTASIAAHAGLNPNSVPVLLSTARKKLREYRGELLRPA